MWCIVVNYWLLVTWSWYETRNEHIYVTVIKSRDKGPEFDKTTEEHIAGDDCESDTWSVKHDAEGLSVYTVTSEKTGSPILVESEESIVGSKETVVETEVGCPVTELDIEDAYL